MADPGSVFRSAAKNTRRAILDAYAKIDDGQCKSALRLVTAAAASAATASARAASTAFSREARRIDGEVARLEASFSRRCVRQHGWMGGRSTR